MPQHPDSSQAHTSLFPSESQSQRSEGSIPGDLSTSTPFYWSTSAQQDGSATTTHTNHYPGNHLFPSDSHTRPYPANQGPLALSGDLQDEDGMHCDSPYDVSSHGAVAQHVDPELTGWRSVQEYPCYQSGSAKVRTANPSHPPIHQLVHLLLPPSSFHSPTQSGYHYVPFSELHPQHCPSNVPVPVPLQSQSDLVVRRDHLRPASHAASPYPQTGPRAARAGGLPRRQGQIASSSSEYIERSSSRPGSRYGHSLRQMHSNDYMRLPGAGGDVRDGT